MINTFGALTLALLGASSIQAQQQYLISTVAGGAPPPMPIEGVQASIGYPVAVITDGAGSLYFSSYSCVFKVDSSGTLTLVAGNSRSGYSGDGGPATGAQISAYNQLGGPLGLALDASGSLYIADTGNQRIRKVSATGIITTVAGNASYGYYGDGGPATSAQLNAPSGVAIDAGGNLYIADSSNNRVRRVSAAGIITTVAGMGHPGYSGDGGPATNAQLNVPSGVAVDASGNLYIADSSNSRIRKVSTAGIITTVAGDGSFSFSGDGEPASSAELNVPVGVAVDANGNLYIADIRNQRIRKVSAAGIITTIAGDGSEGFSGDGGPATGASLEYPPGVAVDGNGNIYVADGFNSRIRKVSAAGIITTVAGNGSPSYSGDGVPATSAQLYGPAAVALDLNGTLYIADSVNGRIRKVSAAGIITTVAGNGSSGFSGDGGPATSAQLSALAGVAVDTSGNLYFADNSRIRKVSRAGIITTVAGIGPCGLECNPLGDGGPATSAQLNGPSSVALDSQGNLFIADSGDGRIRKVSAAGIITTIAGGGPIGHLGDGGPATSASLALPFGVAIDSGGTIYIADSGDALIRKVSTAGIITTVAGGGPIGYVGDGGSATSASLGLPSSVAIDANGNLYIADSNDNRVRKVSATGIITTIAGNGSYGYSGDGGPGTSAQLFGPSDVAVDASGNVYFADPGNNAIRLLTPSESPCGYAISSTAFSYGSTSFQTPAAGGSLPITITTVAGCTWTVSNLPNWITISGPAPGSGSASLTLAVAANAGAPRVGLISVAGVAVTVTQASGMLLVNTDGVVSNASFTAPLAPGSIAAVFGNFLLATPLLASSLPIPTSLGGLSLRFNGQTPAPLFYADVGQVDAQVPWELAGQPQATITANEGDQSTAPQIVSLAIYAPGIFEINGGGGQGAILDVNNRLVDITNPATPGSTIVQIFCTGLGPVTHQPATGTPSPSTPLAETTTQPTVTIGGVPAQVQFSGLAPGYVGLYQVNSLVPPLPQAPTSGVPLAVPVVISIGGVQSNAVAIAVLASFLQNLVHGG